ncbi:MAG: hypothetical protein WCT01_05160 [Candidatus Shapirobacteria bacterium]
MNSLLSSLLNKKKETVVERLKREIEELKQEIEKQKKENSKKKSVKKSKRIWQKTTSKVSLARLEQNPIIGPRAENEWEAWQTFNPGVVLVNDKVHMVYRAVSYDGVSRLGYAASDDGFTIKNRLSYPVYEHKESKREFNVYSYASGGGWGGAEDPRLVLVEEEDTIYMTYTACQKGLRVGLTSIKVKDFEKNYWKWKPPVLISPPGKVNKNWMIFPEKINGKYAILHAITPDILVEYFDNLEFDGKTFIENSVDPKLMPPQEGCWDKWVRGPGAPPLKTKDGWLVFYHAMDDDRSKYKIGAMLLDLTDPTKIIARTKQPILEPDAEYENNGFKAGVVYLTGAIIKDGNILVYYGCADSYVGVACANLDEFLGSLKTEHIYNIKLKPIKK